MMSAILMLFMASVFIKAKIIDCQKNDKHVCEGGIARVKILLPIKEFAWR